MTHETLVEELQALRQALPESADSNNPPTRSVARIPYSLELAARILNYSLEGLSLKEIAETKSEMPAYTTLLRWSKTHPEFSKALRELRQSKALAYEEEALETARNTSDPAEVPAARLKVDTLKWAAEVNDPEVYGKKVQTQHTGGPATVIQVVTGFGPPNPWQTPPKLNSDGTICKDLPVIEAESERLDAVDTDTRSYEKDAGRNQDEASPTGVNAGTERSATQPGHAEPPSGSSDSH